MGGTNDGSELSHAAADARQFCSIAYAHLAAIDMNGYSMTLYNLLLNVLAYALVRYTTCLEQLYRLHGWVSWV